MSKTRFTVPGVGTKETMEGPAGVVRRTGTSPGVTLVQSFEQAKNFARLGPEATGTYTPLLRPARRASRLNFPDAPSAFGLKEL